MESTRHLPLAILFIAVAVTTCMALTSCDPAAPTTTSSAAADPSVQHQTASGQAEAAEMLTPPQTLPGELEAWATLTLSTSDGSLVQAYAVANTEFYERGPNDADYRMVDPRSEGFVAYSNWAGGGFCPAEFEYDAYDSGDGTVNVLTRVRYFLNGE